MKESRELNIVRPPAPVQITPELPTATAVYSEMYPALQEIWSGPRLLREINLYC